MKPMRIVAALALALVAAACQTAGGSPSPTAVQRLLAAGYKSEPTDEFNKDLTADDIRTTASFACDEDPRCRGISIVVFGEDPEGTTTRRELDEAMRQPRNRRVSSLNRLLRSVGIKDIRVTNFGLIGGHGGAPIYQMDAEGPVAGEMFRMRLIMDYRSGRGRALLVGAEAKSDALRRFGNTGMLE
jgi:hypothetical protein